MAQKIIDIYLNCLIWCKYVFIVIIALLVVYLIYTIIGKIYYKRIRNKQYPCETCLNSESVSNHSPCYNCYDKSEYVDKEDIKNEL